MAGRTLYLPALIAGVVLVACAVAVLLGVSEKAEAAFPGKNGRIAYEFFGGRGGGIYTINPGGGGKTRVTRGEQPSYSPNGNKIAYTGFKRLGSSDDEDFDHEIYTINIGGGGKTQVTDTKYFASDPSWGSRP
jgi:hypothetical protein